MIFFSPNKYAGKCEQLQEIITDDLIDVAGYSDRTLEGSNVSFSCLLGRVLSGPSTSTCMSDGRWTPDPRQLECKGKI